MAEVEPRVQFEPAWVVDGPVLVFFEREVEITFDYPKGESRDYPTGNNLLDDFPSAEHP